MLHCGIGVSLAWGENLAPHPNVGKWAHQRFLSINLDASMLTHMSTSIAMGEISEVFLKLK